MVFYDPWFKIKVQFQQSMRNGQMSNYTEHEIDNKNVEIQKNM